MLEILGTLGVLAGFGSWCAGWLNGFVWSPERVLLLLANLGRGSEGPLTDRFRIVLCWLEGDRNGKNTKYVAQAFTSVEGVKLVRSCRCVEASGAADDWRETVREKARSALEDWDADLALVGLVKQPGEALSLWFVPGSGGEGTLSRGDRPYELVNATLGSDFRHDLLAELTAEALIALAPLASTAARGRVLEKELGEITEKLDSLLDNSRRGLPDEWRGRVQLLIGNARAVLGEMAPDTARLKQAVATYRVALTDLARDRVPREWAAAQNGLGIALATLGEREPGTGSLEEAVVAYSAALEETHARAGSARVGRDAQ